MFGIRRVYIFHKLYGEIYWKYMYLPPKGDDLVVPRRVQGAYQDIVDDCSYFAATICPQHTYYAKHSRQGLFLNHAWQYESRHLHALQDFTVFCDQTLGTWRFL
eukprot:GHVU01202653.1.p2 GENE.GHVU01202653.1~~GHVU01202653.1.p2  ORF type:complete len:104 (+),score=4.82 GHVU01202653.1:162-473(+)